VIDYVSSTDIEVHTESRMIGDAAGLGAFEKILRRVSELDGKVTALRGENATLQRGHSDLEGKIEALQEFKAKVRIPELLGNLPSKRGIDRSVRNETVHGADLKSDLELIRSLKKNGSTIIGGYRLQYDVVCHAFKKTYGYRYKEIPQVVPKEVVHVFDMRSNLMNLHYWNHDTSKIRESRRDNLKQRCDEILKIWFSGTPYSKEQTEIKLNSMIRDYWRDDKEP
jgi:hypothetical protein